MNCSARFLAWNKLARRFLVFQIYTAGKTRRQRQPPRHRLTHSKISKSMAKKITMMASSHNIFCSFTSV